MNEIGHHLIIYNDKDINYIRGDIYEINVEPHYFEYNNSGYLKQYYETSKTFSVTTANAVNSETIKLDDTLMKRIAKFNKEIEIKKLDEKIKQKEDKIKELDDILQDKSKRVNKIKEFIANIYNIDINEDDDDYEDYDY